MSTRLGRLASGWRVRGTRLVAVGLAAVCLSAAWAGGGRGVVQVVESRADQIVLEYQLGVFDQRVVDVNGQPYVQLALPHEAQLLTAGAPQLPHVARSVLLPDEGELAVAVTAAPFYEVENVDLAPSKGNLSRQINPEDVAYRFGLEYATDAFFPGALATLGEPYILRDCRGAVVDLYPFQYNPVRRTLRVYTALTVTVTPVGPGGVNPLPAARFQRGSSAAFNEVYRAQFVNAGTALQYTPLDEAGNLLIICADAWLANVQPLVDHKNQIGIPTTVVGISTVGNTAPAIKSYIQNLYNTSNLAFVLLVGDAAQIATPYVTDGAGGNGPGDPTYGLVAGTDNYPDIMIGRFSAESAADVNTQVQRSVEYETLQMTQQTWFKKATGIGSEFGAGQGDNGEADYVHIGNIRTLLLAHGYSVVDEFYGTNGATAAMVSTALNAGRGLMNYCGHGSETGWGTTGYSNSNVTALVNDNKLPIVFSVACVNGKFDYAYGPCFAEAWLRSVHNGEPIGAVATYMASINQDWTPPMAAEDAFDVLLTDGTYHSFGTLCYASSCAMMDKYPGSSGINMFNTWHVFGDPSLRVVGIAAPPSGMRVTPTTGLSAAGDQGGPFAPNSVTYTLLNLGSTPIDYQITKTQAWVAVDSAGGTLPGNGSVNVTVSISGAANGLGNGLYADTVSITNTTAHEGDTTRSVTLKVGVPTAQYAWSFDTNPGWTISGGEWAFGPPTGQGGGTNGYPDPTGGATGANVYGVNLAGNYSPVPGGPYYLTLGPVNLSGVSDVSLRFKRWLNSDYQPFVYATVEASNNGATWTELWSNGGGVLKENAWSSQQYDISGVAANQSAVYIRWGYKVSSGAFVYSGWNVDDVAIWGLKSTAPALRGDMNCDGSVNYADINPFVLALTTKGAYESAYPNCRRLNGDIDGDGAVNYADINPFVTCIANGGCP